MLLITGCMCGYGNAGSTRNCASEALQLKTLDEHNCTALTCPCMHLARRRTRARESFTAVRLLEERSADEALPPRAAAQQAACWVAEAAAVGLSKRTRDECEERAKLSEREAYLRQDGYAGEPAVCTMECGTRASPEP